MICSANATPLQRLHRWTLVGVAFVFLHSSLQSHAADRTVMLLPVGTDVTPKLVAADQTLPNAMFPDDAGWRAMMDLWRAHHAGPDNADIRRFLGLPLVGDFELKAKRSRTAPSWLGWKAGEYAEVDTPHFTIYSHADRAATEIVAKDIERCYWAWTQFFFPLWEAAPQVTLALADRDEGVSIVDQLSQTKSRISLRRKLRVVLFRDAEQYAKTLSKDVPGIERSTGFYSDARKTMCLYVGDVDDAATRRHELVHQLFREATRSRLGRGMPGEATEFWLVEGIAGYFESLFINGDQAIDGDQAIVANQAVVGGWDSPRLQFARYRSLVGGDVMLIGELQQDGRLAAQKRDDLARWYAHAIAQTHRLADSEAMNDRIWLFRRLAALYKIDADLPEATEPEDTAQAMTSFLVIDDKHVIDHPTVRPIESLCLAGCEVTDLAVKSIGPQPTLNWLDLSRLPVGDDAVASLIVAPEKMEQLSLEASKVTEKIARLIGRMTALNELDLSWTAADDSVVDAITSGDDMTVLWMTGTRITDDSIAKIKSMPKLESVDLQRTGVTATAIETLKQNTSATVNPLELRTSP